MADPNQQQTYQEGVPAAHSEIQFEVKSQLRAFFYCAIICIAPLYSGYSLTVISATSVQGLISYYNAQLPRQSILSLLNGVLPLGAILGCLLIPRVMPLTNKKQIWYILLPCTVLTCGLSVVPSFWALLVSRLILGVINAFCISVPAAYIKETFPVTLRKPFGAVYSCGRTLGILICYSIGSGFRYREDRSEHILVYFGLSYIAFVQAVLVRFCIPHSPIEMMAKKNEEELLAAVETLYHKKDVEAVIKQMRASMEAARYHGTRLATRKNFLSYHLALLRQLCGVNFIIVYARQTMFDMGSNLANESPIIINSIQLLSGIAGIFLVDRLERGRSISYSTVSLAVITLLIGVTDLLDQSFACLIAMTIFMVPYGSCFNSFLWSYPSELASAKRGKYTSIFSWSGAALVALIPPYVSNAMPEKSAYPVFFFFTLYLIVATIINRLVLRQMKQLETRSLEMNVKMKEFLVE